MRVLFWLLVLVGAVFLVRKKLREPGKSSPSSAPPSSAGAPGSGEVESMLRCDHCGVFVPASEAVKAQDSGRSYCCDEHRSLHIR